MTAENPKPVIRAIVLDIDGTLICRDASISPANRDAIARATARGLPVVLATGRIPTETVGYYRQLHLAAPLVCYHGAIVLAGGPSLAECRPGAWRHPATLHDAPLEPATARRLVAAILDERPDGQILLGLVDRYLINRLGDLPKHWDMGGPSRPQVALLETGLDERIYKICYYSTNAGDVSQVCSRATAEFGDTLSCQHAHPHLAEFIAPGVSKAASVEVALRALGVEWSAVLAVGDYYNDAEMIARAAIGVAMADAPDDLKARADFVTAGCDASGVALALERFVL